LSLQPDSFGAPRALATYHGILGDFDAIADWLSNAIGQHDPAIRRDVADGTVQASVVVVPGEENALSVSS